MFGRDLGIPSIQTKLKASIRETKMYRELVDELASVYKNARLNSNQISKIFRNALR